MGLTYTQAIGKALWQYFHLSDFFHVKIEKLRGRQRSFDEVGNLWQSIIEPSYMKTGKRKINQLNTGKVVKLENFNIVEWFPWYPGRFWTDWGRSLRYMARSDIMRRRPTSLRGYRTDILRPNAKTLTVASGVGSVRMREHIVGETKFKILGATTERDSSSSVPVVMTEKAYGKIKEKIERNGSVNATIEGTYSELPPTMDYLVNPSLGIPRSCIVVNSKLLVNKVKLGGDIKVPAWTIYDNKKHTNIDFAYCYFSVMDEKGPARAGKFLADYIRHFRGTPITDYDEKVSRLPATIPITQVAEGTIDSNLMRKLQERIISIYYKPKKRSKTR